jgi:hypothetical protein
VRPDDRFEDLESRLRGRRMPMLPSELRDRVLADVSSAAEPAPIVSWRLAASLAAGVLVALNVAAMGSNLFAGPVVPRVFPPPGTSVASTDSGAVAPRFGSPWLPCDLPGGR